MVSPNQANHYDYELPHPSQKECASRYRWNNLHLEHIL